MARPLRRAAQNSTSGVSSSMLVSEISPELEGGIRKIDHEVHLRSSSSVGDRDVDLARQWAIAAHPRVAAKVVLVGVRYVFPVDDFDALEAGFAKPLHYLRRVLAVGVTWRETIASRVERSVEGERRPIAI